VSTRKDAIKLTFLVVLRHKKYTEENRSYPYVNYVKAIGLFETSHKMIRNRCDYVLFSLRPVTRERGFKCAKYYILQCTLTEATYKYRRLFQFM
jgi:hypothetical protein